MLHDFAVSVATFITIMGSVLAHDAQQFSTAVGNVLHPAATSVSYSGVPHASPQPAAAATAQDPFHPDTQPAAAPPAPQPAPSPKQIDPHPTAPAPTQSQLTGHVLGASTNSITTNSYSSNLAAAAARFGSTATSTFAANGALTTSAITVLGASQFGNSANFFSSTAFGATGTTTIATNGTISTPSVLASVATAYSASIGSLIATSSFIATNETFYGVPIAPAFTATSTTATSTFAGGITGPNSFTVQSSSGNVGIGTTTPNRTLTLAGALGFYGSGGNREAGNFSGTTNATGGTISLNLLNSVGQHTAWTASSPSNGIVNQTLYGYNSSQVDVNLQSTSFFSVTSNNATIFSAGNLSGANGQYVRVTGATTTINQGAGDFDFEVKGNGTNGLLYADAGTNRVGRYHLPLRQTRNHRLRNRHRSRVRHSRQQ